MLMPSSRSCAEIDHQLERGRLRNRKVGSVVAPEDTAGIDAGLAAGRRDIRAITHQTAGRGKLAERIDRRHPEARR